MNFKTIDCRIKELYCNVEPIKSEDGCKRANNKFWLSMNVVGMHNITFQKLKTA